MIARYLLAVLQAGLDTIGDLVDVRYVVVLADVRIVRVDLVEAARVVGEVAHDELEYLAVLLLVDVRVVEHVRRAEHTNATLALLLDGARTRHIER